MKSIFANPLTRAIALLLMVNVGPSIAQAELPEVPLARASDIDFLVEYSTDRLMLGDILYAEIRLSNKMDHQVRIVKSTHMRVFAKTSTAKERNIAYCDNSGDALFELNPGQEIVCYIALDIFGNDNLEDGEFNLFDSALDGQVVILQADRATLEPHMMTDPNYRVYVMQHEHKIKFGPALIEKKDFDDAVAAELASEELKPLKLPFGFSRSQTSYLLTRAFGYRHWNRDPLSIIACLRVLSQRLPEQSSLRRSASIVLAADRFALAGPDAEDKAISALISLLSEAAPIERKFLRLDLLEKLQAIETGFLTKTIVSKEKFDRFVKRLEEAGT